MKICHTKELEGMKYAKREARVECFADDTKAEQFYKRRYKAQLDQ